MAQVYVPSVDLVLLIHTGALAAAAVQRALGPWLSSREHLKALFSEPALHAPDGPLS